MDLFQQQLPFFRDFPISPNPRCTREKCIQFLPSKYLNFGRIFTKVVEFKTDIMPFKCFLVNFMKTRCQLEKGI